DLIHAVLEMKLRNPDWGCPRIAAQISLAFGVLINKDVVRRILATHYRLSPDVGGGPSWLTFLGHMKDSLWSIDLFRCESLALRNGKGSVVPPPDQSGSRNEPIRQAVLARLNASPMYRALFGQLFPSVALGGPIDFSMFGRAIAEFEFTLVFADAPIDRFA